MKLSHRATVLSTVQRRSKHKGDITSLVIDRVGRLVEAKVA
jgi:hypothetical protein